MRSPDAPSGSTLRALLVEDSENDALLVAEELRRGGYEPACERVSTPEEMELALTEASARGEPWQVVLSDYYMPHFGAPDALALLRRLGYDTPFIVVSGKIGEDAAVAMMQAGAQDYVIKENLARLCPAIERELREAAVRQERKKAEEALNRSREAQRLLAEAGAVLSSSLDYQVTLESLARLVVPRLADWCAVDVVAEDESTHRLAVEHQNPEKVRLAHELQRRYPPDPGARQGTPQVLRSGRSEFYPEITEEMIEAAARDEEHLRLLREMAFASLIIVPLVARGKTLGAITLVSAESGRRFGEADLRVAEELARRAALAMDNAKLYEEAQKEIAERKRAEEELRRSEERYRAVVEQSTEGIYLLDAETKRIL
ncbi:MAG: GAF domain-containing protein, partial [Rubrobacter sp.]|nr:GAF domain-containing protein [Rubrobacter sp.]